MGVGALRTVIGIAAHVDAGKTTLSEQVLCRAGVVRKPGRVDHGDAFLDADPLERRRGITIYAGLARLQWDEDVLWWLDTPGHSDFSPEMERALAVMDDCVLVVSAAEGIQSHTETLWSFLKQRQVPTFLFLNKTDLPAADPEAVLADLRRRFSRGILDLRTWQREGKMDAALAEELALCDEELLECWERGAFDERLWTEKLRELIQRREVFPLMAGAALSGEGVDGFLRLLRKLTGFPRDEESPPAGVVWKVTHGEKGETCAHIKLLRGRLRIKDSIQVDGAPLQVHDLRLCQGSRMVRTDEVRAGDLAVCVGAEELRCGSAFGGADPLQLLGEPMIATDVSAEDRQRLLKALRILETEEPSLHVTPGEQGITLRTMGRVQLEVLQTVLRERFGLEVTFGPFRVLYRETVAAPAVGIGHYEPLRHYAEVWLRLVPGEPGSGVRFTSLCHVDTLALHWQRLIGTHVLEREHAGVLTGSPLTDVEVQLITGRSHLKHTEGGDFREATYRALRQGLMQAHSVLLEPWFAFRIEVPPEQIGRAISDVRAMNGSFDSPEDAGEMLCLRGSAPAAKLNGYMEELVSYSHGRGRLSLRLEGYHPCREQDQIVEAIGYDPESDTENPADSVFCAHGGGFLVKWDRVPEYMHLESCLKKPEEPSAAAPIRRSLSIDERELEAIMEREFGPIRRPQYQSGFRNEAQAPLPALRKKEYLIVDGYNLIFAWDELKALAAERLDLARSRLVDLLSSYCGFTRAELVLVFDGFRTPGNPGSHKEVHNIRVVFTKDGETGDAYIERLVDEIGKNYDVRVVTSDNLIRLSALRSGVLRTSSREFSREVEWVLEQIEEILKKSNQEAHQTRLRDSHGEQ